MPLFCRNVNEKLSRPSIKEKLMDYPNSGDVDGALEYIQNLTNRFRKRHKKKQLRKLAGYVERRI
jgi:hypothetical protein